MNTKVKIKQQSILNEQKKIIKELEKANKHLSNALDLETKCKNKAYFFILDNDYYCQYVKYHYANPTENF